VSDLAAAASVIRALMSFLSNAHGEVEIAPIANGYGRSLGEIRAAAPEHAGAGGPVRR
jgi:hypothetical protein